MATKPIPVTAEQLNRVDQAISGFSVEEAALNIDAPMAARASSIEEAANVDSITEIIQAIGREMNTEKAKLAVALLNVTSYAVGLQGRSAWNTRDFMSFGVALAALGQIDGSDPSRVGINEYAPRARNINSERVRHEPNLDALERAIQQER